MCFNQTTSLITFSISLICFTYLLYYGFSHKNKYDLFAATLTILIGSMQLIEYFLWGSQNCSKINHFYSLSIMVLLYLQGVLGSLVFMYLFGNKLKTSLNTILNKGILFCIGIYTAFTIYLLSWLNQKKLCSTPMGGSCRLVWAPFQTLFNDPYGQILLFIFLFFYFLLGTYAFGGFELLNGRIFEGHMKYPLRYSILTFTFNIAILYSFLTKGTKLVDIFGTTWCFMAVAFGIISCLHV